MRNSARSSDMSSLLRQQAKLDKSVAGLQLYSSSPANRSRLNGSYSPAQSEFSLSRFPEPPYVANGGRFSSASRASGTVTGEDFIVDDMEFTLVPPQMPAASGAGAEGGRQTSFPLSSRGSNTESIDLSSRNRMYDSNGTQYDVTSFIGDLTAPPGPPAMPTGLATIPSDDETSPKLFPQVMPRITVQGQSVTLEQRDAVRPTVAPLIIKSGIQTITDIPVATRRPNNTLRRPKQNGATISAPFARVSIDQPAAFERPRRPPVAAPPSAFR